MNAVEELIEMGYPKKIKGNGGYEATLVGVQPLLDGEVAGVYRYPGGDAVHHISEINAFFAKVDIRDSLKLYLDAHDVVQAQLAAAAGMTRQKLNAALHKQRKLDANELLRICDVLEISADDLRGQT